MYFGVQTVYAGTEGGRTHQMGDEMLLEGRELAEVVEGTSLTSWHRSAVRWPRCRGSVAAEDGGTDAGCEEDEGMGKEALANHFRMASQVGSGGQRCSHPS